MNIIAIKGRLVRDPSTKTTPNGVTVCNITVAVDRAYSGGGEKQTTASSAATPEYKCADCGKPFETFRDPASGKIFTPAEVFQMAQKRNVDGVARCAECRKKRGGA